MLTTSDFCPESAATTPSAESETARAVGARWFAETIAAHGGESFLNLRSLTMVGKGEFTTPPQTGGLTVPLASFTWYIAAGGRSRLEARSPGGPLLLVSRGRGRGGFVFLAGRMLELPAEQTDGLEPTEFLRETARQGYPITAVRSGDPERAGDGTPLRRYEIQREKGQCTRISVDAESKLVRKTVQEMPRGEMTVLLSDYQTICGLPLFGAMELRENGAPVLELRMSDFLLNEPMANSLFEGR